MALEGTVRRPRGTLRWGWVRADGGQPICLSLDFSIRNLEEFTRFTDMKRLSVRMGLAEDSGPGIVMRGDRAVCSVVGTVAEICV